MTDGRWLSGWKAIADYLGVSERTARLYADRGMPVCKPGGVQASTQAIDGWLKRQIPADSGNSEKSSCDPP